MLDTQEQPSIPDASYLIGLNEMQRQAVTHTEGPLMIIAGAGSGKTKVLTSRIAHLLKEQKATPHQILALTFTNKAAAEMRHRIVGIIGDSAKAIWLGTFHSVFVRFLRMEAHRLGYPAHFTIYDSEDSKSLLKQIVKDLNLDDKIYKPNLLLSRISHFKNKLISAHIYAGHSTYQTEDARMRIPRFGEIFLRYTNYCHKAAAMDFDDLLLHTHTLLHNNAELTETYQRKFSYVFVDEFQDTNLVQYSMLKKLVAHHQNICVVGDDAQSIYAFRGADIQNILHFTKDYPQHTVVKLEQNYRSTKRIVDVANQIIRHNEAQLPKKVWTDNNLGEPIEMVKATSDVEEARLVVASLLAQKRKHAVLYQDFVILYRTNNQSRNFEEALRRSNIPYRIIGGLSFYQRKEVKDFIAYLSFLVNHNDAESFKRIINLPKRGIGSVTVDKIFAIAYEQERSLWDILCDATGFLGGAVAIAVGRFVALIQEMTDRLASENAYLVAVAVAKESGFLKELYEDKTIEGLTRYEHIQELLNGIKQFVDDAENNDASLGRFIQEIALITDGDQETQQQDAVTLMTIHTSKGMEFKYVYLVGMEEDLFPSSMMLGSKADVEEERRLFYVAVTRAQLKLTLSYALSRYRFGKLTHTQPSRFLNEVVLVPQEPKKVGMAPTRVVNVPPRGNINGTFKIGDHVKHAHFGTGQIIQLMETEGVSKAIIFFHNRGNKTLLLNYAKLEILPTQ